MISQQQQHGDKMNDAKIKTTNNDYTGKIMHTTTEELSKIIDVMEMVKNKKCMPFAHAIVINAFGADVNDITDFFEYWDNMNERSGLWIDETTYAYDAICATDGTFIDGVLFDDDNILDAYDDYMDEIHVEHLRDQISALKRELS